jgi:4-oxalocrotonate tautomerase
MDNPLKMNKQASAKSPEYLLCFIDEVDTDNWGIGGETITVRRQQGK